MQFKCALILPAPVRTNCTVIQILAHLGCIICRDQGLNACSGTALMLRSLMQWKAALAPF